MFSIHERVGMGGGGEGFAFVLDADFYRGGSYRSETFGTPRLTNSETFRVRNVEVWGFDSVLRFTPKVKLSGIPTTLSRTNM